MKKIALSLAFATVVAAGTPDVEARTRFPVGFSYGAPAYCYRPVYPRPVVMRAHSGYRHKRLKRPYYYRAYFKHRPYGRVIVRTCY
jgi:hypothetical protein